MGLETFALINSTDQVVNHVVIDKEADNFEIVMADQLAHWNCVRYVETTEDNPLIILHESDEIWTTHTEDEGFVLPDMNLYYETLGQSPVLNIEEDSDFEAITINGRTYPSDSLLIKENASKRPANWVLPEDEEEVSLADKE